MSLSSLQLPGSTPAGTAGALPDTAPRKWVQLEARDSEGNSALCLATALGHADCVRVLVEGGAEVGGGDAAGWTALHWAVQNNDIPIAAYLLNHRASPTVTSHKGLTPEDLIKRGQDGEAMRAVLMSAIEAAEERERQALMRDLNERDEGVDDDESSGISKAREKAASLISFPTVSRSGSNWALDAEKVEKDRRERAARQRQELARESAAQLEVDPKVLGVDLPEVEDEEEEQGVQTPFVWEQCLPDQMLVFTLDELPILFDLIITNKRPVRDRQKRALTANVIFLCARYASSFGTPDLLEELIVGAMERIEEAVHKYPTDMANCSFWLSNCLLLLYYLRKDPHLLVSTSDMQVHLGDLINEIFVFVIRDAERRMDRVLEPAILEHEQLPGFESVGFEDEWASTRFVKKLTGRTKRPSSIYGNAMNIFNSDGRDSPQASPVKPRNGKAPASQPQEEANPRHVTSLLSSTLFVLQTYEIPPSIIVQAFSQLFYWIACEVFNRLLIQKKYLCRSKAMQIRLNASNLEDWGRSNEMPTKMISVHFAPLNQLLQWLQCLSSESSIDGLIGTIQSLRALNPLQLRRAVRDYRHEVDETKMGEDCAQYLLQIQKQWERMRVQRTVEDLQQEQDTPTRSNSPTESAISVQSDVVRMIDKVFSAPSSFGHYTPPGGSEALGELLNSRYMLPFALPSSAEMLLNLRRKDAFGPFAAGEGPHGSDGTTTPKSSAASVASRRSLGASANGNPRRHSAASDSASLLSVSTDGGRDADEDEGETEFTPLLPDDFFALYDQAKVAAYERARRMRGHPGLAGGRGMLPSTPVGAAAGGMEGVYDWRANMPTDTEDSTDGEDEMGLVQETPRPKAGFSHRIL